MEEERKIEVNLTYGHATRGINALQSVDGRADRYAVFSLEIKPDQPEAASLSVKWQEGKLSPYSPMCLGMVSLLRLGLKKTASITEAEIGEGFCRWRMKPLLEEDMKLVVKQASTIFDDVAAAFYYNQNNPRIYEENLLGLKGVEIHLDDTELLLEATKEVQQKIRQKHGYRTNEETDHKYPGSHAHFRKNDMLYYLKRDLPMVLSVLANSGQSKAIAEELEFRLTPDDSPFTYHGLMDVSAMPLLRPMVDNVLSTHGISEVNKKDAATQMLAYLDTLSRNYNTIDYGTHVGEILYRRGTDNTQIVTIQVNDKGSSAQKSILDAISLLAMFYGAEIEKNRSGENVHNLVIHETPDEADMKLLSGQIKQILSACKKMPTPKDLEIDSIKLVLSLRDGGANVPHVFAEAVSFPASALERYTRAALTNVNELNLIFANEKAQMELVSIIAAEASHNPEKWMYLQWRDKGDDFGIMSFLQQAIQQCLKQHPQLAPGTESVNKAIFEIASEVNRCLHAIPGLPGSFSQIGR